MVEQTNGATCEAGFIARAIAEPFRHKRFINSRLGHRFGIEDCKRFVASMIDTIDDETLDTVADILYTLPQRERHERDRHK